MRKKIASIIIVVLIAGSLIAFFYPKHRVVGGFGGELIGPNQTAYREEYDCFGIKYDLCPSFGADYTCDALCYGAIFNKKCFIEVSENEGGIQKKPIDCK